MVEGTLYVKIDDEFVPIAPCTSDGEGVFVAEETDRKSSKKTITFRRIGTIPARASSA